LQKSATTAKEVILSRLMGVMMLVIDTWKVINAPIVVAISMN
jgi:hypothetical protein